MVVISARELAKNRDKYFDLAESEQVVLQRNRRLFELRPMKIIPSLIDEPHQRRKCEDPHAGWEEDAIRCHQNGDDELLIPDVFEDENFDWWTWKE